MELWSYHSPEFSLLQGRVDPTKSKFAQDYPDAYQKLCECLGTDQIVWCCTSRDDWPQKTGYCEWALDVPNGDFFRIVDYMVWNGILG